MKRPSRHGGKNAGWSSKKALEEERTLVLVDEAALYLLPAVVRTYAPRGCTPVLQAPCSREHLSLIGGITPEGQLFQKALAHSVKGEDVVAFLKHLLRYLDRILVAWDGLPAHRSKRVKQFLAEDAQGRVHLEQFPGYAPELNPKEGIWRHLKRCELKNLCCRNLQELKGHYWRARERLRHNKELIRACFRMAGLV